MRPHCNGQLIKSVGQKVEGLWFQVWGLRTGQESKRTRGPESKGAREQGSKRAREHESTRAREQEGKRATEQDSQRAHRNENTSGSSCSMASSPSSSEDPVKLMVTTPTNGDTKAGSRTSALAPPLHSNKYQTHQASLAPRGGKRA